jgi:hypothetical protein
VATCGIRRRRRARAPTSICTGPGRTGGLVNGRVW